MLMPTVFGESLFDDFFNGFPFYDERPEREAEKKLYGRNAKNLMKTDIRENDNGYTLEMDLPGFKKDEVKVSLENGCLTVSASKGLDQSEQDEKTGKYIRRERFAGTCERSFYVGEDVEENDIKGSFEHGILTLTVPKKQEKPVVEGKKYISLEG